MSEPTKMLSEQNLQDIYLQLQHIHQNIAEYKKDGSGSTPILQKIHTVVSLITSDDQHVATSQNLQDLHLHLQNFQQNIDQYKKDGSNTLLLNKIQQVVANISHNYNQMSPSQKSDPLMQQILSDLVTPICPNDANSFFMHRGNLTANSTAEIDKIAQWLTASPDGAKAWIVMTNDIAHWVAKYCPINR